MSPFTSSIIVKRPWLVVLLAMVMGIRAWSVPTGMTMLTTPNTTKPSCPRKCGNLTVPYPFGVGFGPGCSMNSWYDIFCKASSDGATERAYLVWARAKVHQNSWEIMEINEKQIRLRNDVAYKCSNSSTNGTLNSSESVFLELLNTSAPFSVSSTSNKLISVGCHDYPPMFVGYFDPDTDRITNAADNSASCSTNCSANAKSIVAGECNGNGCCQSDITAKGLRYFMVYINDNFTDTASNKPCGYAFLGDPERFKFHGVSDLEDPNFANRIRRDVPVVLDWVIGNHSCAHQAQQDAASYACQQNTLCLDATDSGIRGYRCSCRPGYQGNPYLAPGCSDINECEDSINSPCSYSKHCTNTPGNYTCSCPFGRSGDGRKDGNGCNPHVPILQLALGIGFGSLFLLFSVIWLCLAIKKRNKTKIKENFFQKNGGVLLKQLISSNKEDDEVEQLKLFNIRELKVATKNFSEETIVGRGGYGTVYKGILSNNQIVAVKRSKFLDESQIEQFINELVLLARIRHPNVVRLLGCCLEAEVPLLVYEFISNGTLYDHIHRKKESSWYCWTNCLRIARESANAFAYLHSIPIVHRDIKSMNILLDNFTTKIADFGASRLIPLDHTHLSTVVQGTLGYLDPEYFFSSQLTEKSDVYSYGVVLAELLTRARPILPEKRIEENNINLASYFVKCIKEDNLFEILDPQLVAETSQDQLVAIAKLVQMCLSAKGEDRPTMKAISLELEQLQS